MNFLLRKGFFVILLVMLYTASCASTKTLNVWKDEGYSKRLGKTLIVAVAQVDFMRDHFEDVLAWRLSDRGIDAKASNKVIPQLGAKPDRAALVAKVKELGVENVVIAKVVDKDEYARLIPGGVYLVPDAYYSGWNSDESFLMVAVPGAAYDAEFFTVVTNIYEVQGEKLIWSYLSRVKVETSREGAINPFIETVMKQLERSKLI